MAFNPLDRPGPPGGPASSRRVVLFQAESRAMTAMGAKAEELVEKLRSWLS